MSDDLLERKSQSEHYKRLVALTNEAGALEHMVTLQYLYAAFSVKESFADIRGWGASPTKRNLLGVAVQEMQHLHFVNMFRRSLGEPPYVPPRVLSGRSDWYPFELKLEPLSRASAWKYAYLEAPEEKQVELLGAAQGLGVDIVPSARPGSLRLYDAFEEALRATSRELPDLLPEPTVRLWLKRGAEIRDEGHGEHFDFFASLVDGTHPAFDVKLRNPAASWASPKDPMYPSITFTTNEDGPAAFATETFRLTSTLLHASYWLDGWTFQPYEEYSNASRDTRPLYGSARRLMTEVIFPLGCALARNEAAFPFQTPRYPLPSDKRSLMALIMETAKKVDTLGTAANQTKEYRGQFKLDAVRSTLALVAGEQ